MCVRVVNAALLARRAVAERLQVLLDAYTVRLADHIVSDCDRASRAAVKGSETR